MNEESKKEPLIAGQPHVIEFNYGIRTWWEGVLWIILGLILVATWIGPLFIQAYKNQEADTRTPQEVGDGEK